MEKDGFIQIVLFGVRVKVDPMRKAFSMNDLSHHQKSPSHDASYASADDNSLLPSAVTRARKRGIPWTEEEHKLFLMGLERVGKGDWRGISRKYVKTRTPTQVASHAQKYFLRRANVNRQRRRRSSLFDMTEPDLNGGDSSEKSPPALGLSLSLPPSSSSSSSYRNQIDGGFDSSSMIRVT